MVFAEHSIEDSEGCVPRQAPDGGTGVVIAAPVCTVISALAGGRALSAAETARAAAFHHREDAERYRAAHLLARAMIGAAMARPAENLVFDRLSNGKPVLSDAAGIDFNLSHSGDWVAVGLMRSGRIGVDVETERPQPFWEEITLSFLSPSEMASLPEWEIGQFLKTWTAKESALKAEGSGFAIAPDSIAVTARNDGFFVEIGSRRFVGSWLWLDENHLLAVATDSLPPRVTVCNEPHILPEALRNIGSWPVE
ncbi:4'-phosphopantetheinyl transferase superfamily protein [Rhizobium sp. TRM95111]|uniref:4'-phosphopantetheinyl transferase family protein n=1 Tax=Rhizobium alarense TaxID=2846851 RepID=UPI001F414631|nr:4'-phosphopantetheinyl transferase superfamily protein [Rhizobium alarense]MCF3640223.1 4'-phosphopantetheinyl transferase superfamily protein [Rhizobium alarense]